MYAKNRYRATSEEYSYVPGLVSIIIPVRDKNKLAKCLKAIETQTYPKIEIILVEFKGLPAEKRNIGFIASEGEYVYFLDEDEYISPEVVEECVKKAKEGYEIIAVPVIKSVPNEYLARCIAIIRESTYKTMFFKREVLKKIGLFNPTYRLCDDIEIRLRALNAGYKVATIETGSLIHDESITMTDTLRKTLLSRKAFRMLKQTYGREIYQRLVRTQFHRRRIFRELLASPIHILGVALIMIVRFIARRIP
ncbi:MAG: glycosyltransferase [Nitrososphaerota archaeon]|nr:glycosyltransferase [Aigarchaeota archaeon]MDW8076190.1 glycosyltransferase [Nitrososphaerota archaeon]